MRAIAKGFSLIELLVTVSLVGILAAIAIPNFNSTILNNKVDTEVSELQRALNYARLEAINRGVSVQVRPSTDGAAWNTELKVVLSSATATNNALRVIPAMSSGGTLVAANVTVPAANVTVLEFNNLGGLITPASAVALTYTRGSIVKTVNVCLTGRITLGVSCS
jgi:type IV fimbrial biogenesis protein FimU